MSITTHKYSNEEITIVWEPGRCIHSKKCWTNLRAVFDPTKRPWIDPQGASTDTIILQIGQCPSGALSYFRNDDDLISRKDAK